MSGKINVTFVDDRSDTVIGTVDLSPDSLPPSFNQETKLYIDDANWAVMDAQPSTQAEFVAQGSLTLRLSKVESVDPSKMLFSLPSLFDLLPESGSVDRDGTEFQVHPDGWRQVEYVSAKFADAVESEFSSILEIHETSSAASGWTKIHVRTEPLHPISEGLSWAELCGLFPSAIHKGLNFQGLNNRIENSFSLELKSGFCFYGLRNEDQIIVLALDQFSAPSCAEIEKMGAFLKSNELLLVDWCRCISIETAEEVARIFKG